MATSPLVAPAHGTLVLNPNGTYVYTPQAGYSGTDSFTYRLVDADGGIASATVTFTLTAGVDHAPSSTPIDDRTNAIGTTVSVSEASHFIDVDGDPLVYGATGLPPGLSIDPDTGTITGTLTTDGNYTVTVTATDPTGLSTRQSFGWTAGLGVNNGPNDVGALAAASGNDASAVSIATANAFRDPDGDVLTYAATGLPPGLSIDAATGVISGTLDVHASTGGTESDGSGVYTDLVTAADGRGGTAGQAFRFTAINPSPIAIADAAVVDEDGVVTGNVLANDRDPDGDALTVSTTPVVAPTHGTVVLFADGSYVYTPAADYNGTDRFTYRLVDADGGTATATVTLTVRAVADAPASTPLPDLTRPVGTPVSVDEAPHFTDADGDPLVYTAAGLPPGLTIDPSTGVVGGTPTTAGTYRVTVTATDPSGQGSSQAFTFTATNEAPVATPDTTSVTARGPIGGNLLANVVDPNGDALRVETTPIVVPGHGTVSVGADGGYVYTPQAGFSGGDTFSYRIVDAGGQGVVVTVDVTVQPDVTPVVPADPTVSIALVSLVARGDANLAFSALDHQPAARGEADLYPSTEPVLLPMVNDVKRLDGVVNLTSDMPLGTSINWARTLGGRGEVVEGRGPITQVVGDLSSELRTPIVFAAPAGTDLVAPSSDDAPSGSDAGSDAGPGSPSPTTPPSVSSAEPPQASVGAAAAERPLHDAPLSVTAQLRLATLKIHRELAELADAIA